MDTVCQTKTVFLVRHGEAVHNIAEKTAKSQAGAEAEALGFAKGSEEYKARCEAARKAVLKNELFRDASLSENGKAQAHNGKLQFQTLVPALGLPEPTAILVSPLQRTVQTAAIMFPPDSKQRVHIREEVRERRTGLACDEPQPASNMANRQSFAYMSWGNLVQKDMDPDASPSPEVDVREDAAQLRVRTGKLGHLLSTFEDTSICIVTHKGYLRELERGPLKRPSAVEFDTCEVRVYDIDLNAKGDIVNASLREITSNNKSVEMEITKAECAPHEDNHTANTVGSIAALKSSLVPVIKAM
mmetsp:Transcript_46921/g.77898  ORF Transcript_46921/g.77898 Transcript_46921/m.77898 type:complete len:301 (-) Transcript_46921:6-908(-)